MVSYITQLEESEGLGQIEEDTVLGSVLDTSLTSLPSISDVISRLEEDIKQEESLDVHDQTLKVHVVVFLCMLQKLKIFWAQHFYFIHNIYENV